MANIYSLQLLRNGKAYTSKTEAYEALEQAGALSGITNKDGVAVLARYIHTEGEGASQVKQVRTLVGYYAVATAMTGADGYSDYMTIIDVEGAAADVEELKNMIGTGVTTSNTVTKQLQDLSGTTADTSATTSVAGAKKYTDDKVNALDYSLAKDDNKVVVSLNQTDGKISGESVNITSVKLDGYAEAAATGDVATTDTLGEALGKLQKTIHEMDKAADVVAGQVVTTVSEADGVVSETKANVKDLQLGGYVKDTTATGDVASTDTINVALSKLENKAAAITIANDDKSINVTTSATGTNINVNIKPDEKVLAKDGNAGLYTDIKLIKTTGSTLPAEIKERYTLVGINDAQLGNVTIDVPKDSHIVSITYDGTTQKLTYNYVDVSGNTQSTDVDMSELVLETEFGSGVTVTDHVAHGVVDPTSETFLTVGADGFKLSGVQDAINDAIDALDASVTGGTTAGTATTGHVHVAIDEVDGKLTAVTVTETNVADKDKLEELSGKAVTVIESSNSSIAATSTTATDGTVKYDLVTDASKIQMSGFTGTDVLSGIAASSSVTEAFGEVERVITENEEVVSAALNDLNDKIAELSGASASGLTEEIETRKRIEGQSGSAYTANASSPYISGATNMNDADVKLAAAIKEIDDNFVSGATMNGSGVTKTDHALQFAIVAGTSAATDNNAVHIDTANDGTVTISLGKLDCGTYN